MKVIENVTYLALVTLRNTNAEAVGSKKLQLAVCTVY